jgi:hypothetical protein
MINNNDIHIQRHKGLQFYSICGIIPLILFFAWLIIAAILSPGYNGNSSYISPIQVGFYAVLQNVVFVVLGLLTIGLTFGLRIGLPSTQNRLLNMGIWSVMIFSLGVLLAGLLPLVGLFPENYLVIVPYNLLSVTAFAITFVAYISATLLIGQGLKNEDSIIWSQYSRYSLSTGLLFIILLILLIIAIFYSFGPGLTLRVFIIISWVWILMTGVKLYSISTNKKTRWI